jgi:hypothetical protein
VAASKAPFARFPLPLTVELWFPSIKPVHNVGELSVAVLSGLTFNINQGVKLRVFNCDGVVLSTFQPASTDPYRIGTVSASHHKGDNLFPSLLELPLPHDPTSSYEVEPKRKRPYGYPICWSKEGFEWYPYLPAVVSYRYPIFRGVSPDAEIIYDGSGYRLKDEDLCLWANVEHVMTTACHALQAGGLLSLDHFTPPPPSDYGYTQKHAQEKFAKKPMVKSLNAFQRLLAYCPFAAASRGNANPVVDHLPSHHPKAISAVYHKVGSAVPDVHVIVKNLFLISYNRRGESDWQLCRHCPELFGAI